MTVSDVEMQDEVVCALHTQAPTTPLRGRLGTGDRLGSLPEIICLIRK